MARSKDSSGGSTINEAQLAATKSTNRLSGAEEGREPVRSFQIPAISRTNRRFAKFGLVFSDAPISLTRSSAIVRIWRADWRAASRFFICRWKLLRLSTSTWSWGLHHNFFPSLSLGQSRYPGSSPHQFGRTNLSACLSVYLWKYGRILRPLIVE